MELGAAYKAYGSEVIGLTRTDVLRTADGEIKKELNKHLPFPIESHFQIETVEFKDGLFFVTGLNDQGKKPPIPQNGFWWPRVFDRIRTTLDSNILKSKQTLVDTSK